MPNSALAVGRPRRRLEISTTSSCSKVAVWMNSITAANFTCSGLHCPSAAALSSTSRGRRRFTAGIHDVVADVLHHGNVGVELFHDQLIDLVELGD